MKVYTASFSSFSPIVSIPSMQSIHTELKLSVMARGLLMLPSCMELMGMLPPSTVVAALTLMMLATPPLTSIVATHMLMVPDMVHTPTWDKMFYFFCVS